MTFAHSCVAGYAEAASDSQASGARQDSDRLRPDDGPCASDLRGTFRRLECVCPPVHRLESMIMDSERFDRLVQSFGQTRSRRQTVRGLAGIAAAGVLLLGGQEADAAKRIGGSPCTKGRQCKTGKCIGEPGQKVCSCSRRKPACLQPDTSCQSGTCQARCAYGASACETPTTVCGPEIVTCGSNPNCWA